jgi:hypothetical protein
MPFGFMNVAMLVGLAAVAIPVIIHLLNRRRYDVVDWGAMQFLQISETTRRRLLLEELLLLLLRMGLIALMVLALAAPWAASSVFAKLGAPTNRDVVLVFDGSYSMGFAGAGKTPHDAAKEWALAFVGQLAVQDSVAVLQAKQQVVPVLGEPTVDLAKVRKAIVDLPQPRGGCDWPQALQAAHKILAQSKRPQRDIILLTDGQRFGWADEKSLVHWELLADQLRGQPGERPTIRVINLDPDRPADPPNWSLATLTASRAVASAGQEIQFRTALQLRGQDKYEPPYRLRLEVDGGQERRDLPFPATARLEKGQVSLSFKQRFKTAGSHLVSVIVEPDPPPEKRPPGYRVKDQLPGDNRQDVAVEVVEALPVLLVDGDLRPNPATRGTDFLRDALAPARDRTPVVLARAVPVHEFDAAQLTRDLKGPGTRPRVLVLSNVARLTPGQQEGVDRFLTAGGGVLVTLGDRADAVQYNGQLHRDGQGWLPARLEEVSGDENDADQAARPLASSFFHPTLEMFRDIKIGGLAEARFPRWWKVTTAGRDSPAMPVALLTNQDPLLVERAYHGGRVLLCAVPLDNSWRTNLTDLPAFAPLAHQLVYYLAGARSAERNLQPGQPLLYRPEREETPGTLTLQPPEGEAKPLTPAGWPLVYEHTRETGVYRLTKADGRAVYYVVQSDPQESDLTPNTAEDRAKVAKQVPLVYEGGRDNARETAQVPPADPKQELWWWFMTGVVALLCGEVWMTRRIVKGR